MGASPGAATMELFIIGAQKSTNQLKAVLAKLLPATGGARAGPGSFASAVDALLWDITDSLSHALASLRLGELNTQRPPGQSSTAAAGGGSSGRRSAPKRSGQRVRYLPYSTFSLLQIQLHFWQIEYYMFWPDGACRMIVLQNGVQDSYTWRKYGQKEILGARFPRSYFKCGRKSTGCPARKQVQQSDADPSKLEITYFDAHTCDDDPPPSSSQIVPDPTRIISSGTQRSTAARLVLPVTAVPSAQRYIGRPPSPSPLSYPVPDMTPRATDVLPMPVTAVAPAATLSGRRYDPVPDDTTFTTSMEEEQAEMLFIPSPACSQSELLPAEVTKVEPHGPPVWMEHDVARSDEIADFTVPEL